MSQRRRPLTVRLLRAMQAALCSVEAGGMEELALDPEDPGDVAIYEAMTSAMLWVNDELRRREARRGRG